MKIHCFFEQSGTFKNEFEKLGYNAYDYDILNDFGETDFIIDLFNEIEKCYLGEKSIFDNINENDLIFAFFPCTRFEQQITMSFRGESQGIQKWTDEKKLKFDLKLHVELHRNYSIITKLSIICLNKNIKLIIENPFNEQHYLKRYWCIKPSIIDFDRRKRGDFFQKPTQYFFVNCKPKQNLIFESIKIKPTKKISNCKTVERSLISADYANRFIREFLQ